MSSPGGPKPAERDEGKKSEPGPEAQETLLRLTKDVERIERTLKSQQRRINATAQTLAQAEEDLARVAEALAIRLREGKRRKRRTANGKGTIHERKDGRWEARYFDAAGKRRSIYGRSRVTVHVKLVAALDHVRENQSTRD